MSSGGDGSSDIFHTGRKRPRDPTDHCQPNGAIDCPCDSDIDEPLSKRINRLNIDRSIEQQSSNGAGPFHSHHYGEARGVLNGVHNGLLNGHAGVHHGHGALNGHHNGVQHDHHNGVHHGVLNEHQNGVLHGHPNGVMDGNSSMQEGDRKFRENYPFERTSVYYESNNLLYKLYLERSHRQASEGQHGPPSH